ncbi:MAG: DNA-binding response regulator, partial [Methylocella sp.]
MLVIIDEREIVTSGYTCRFGSEGVSSAGFCPLEFQEWVATVADADLSAVEAFLLGDCRNRQLYPKMIKDRTR